ncbi:hypothetical protein BCV69DRAFT_285529 [Microstroma glucosiphilum]|uniref:Uncharacterized protein n=1 Tax=Pseudomicrostroma glucosiphilum TaxID=1684307 RepID=A0A316TZ25_9BASI|nr:hypothetical protein BCV69DRAFT_285529 [Pseudomicrostroma glucosiphilum]PWN17938.1 hypothetical protein BCV69DRAFT_285529 [Pseudomicrostroma glucosiphilum]
MTSASLDPLFPQTILPAVKEQSSGVSLPSARTSSSASSTVRPSSSSTSASPSTTTSKPSSSSRAPPSNWLQSNGPFYALGSLLLLYLITPTLLSLLRTLALFATPYGLTYLSALPFILTDSGDRTNSTSRLLCFIPWTLALLAHAIAIWHTLLRGAGSGLFGLSWFVAGVLSLGLTSIQVVTLECIVDRDFARM